MTRRWRNRALALVAAVALLASGCARGGSAPAQSGRGSANGEEAGSAVDSSGRTPLSLLGWSMSTAEQERLGQILQEFGAANPDVAVSLELATDYDSRLQMAIAAGSPPDVFFVDAFSFPELHANGALEPLGARIEDAGDFYPSLAAAFSAEGTLYCPPVDASTLALVYSRKPFAAAELAEPDATWTWENMRTAAEALTDVEQGAYGLALNADMSRWLAFLYQAGGSVTSDDLSAVTLNSDAALRASTFYAGLVQDGFARQPADLESSWAGEALGRGRAAMVVEGNWIVPFLADSYPDLDYGIVELPAGPAGRATLSFTTCYAVAAAGAHKDAATRLVNYLAGREAMREWTDLGLALPARQSLAAGFVFQYPELTAFVDGLPDSRPWQLPAGFSPAVDAFDAGMRQAFEGTATGEDVLRDAQSAGEQVLSR